MIIQDPSRHSFFYIKPLAWKHTQKVYVERWAQSWHVINSFSQAPRKYPPDQCIGCASQNSSVCLDFQAPFDQKEGSSQILNERLQVLGRAMDAGMYIDLRSPDYSLKRL
jgi:hypothetical protein